MDCFLVRVETSTTSTHTQNGGIGLGGFCLGQAFDNKQAASNHQSHFRQTVCLRPAARGVLAHLSLWRGGGDANHRGTPRIGGLVFEGWVILQEGQIPILNF